MIFSFGKHDTNYGVIVDVHSGSVGIALVHSDPTSNKPKILFSFREYLKILDAPDTPSLLRALTAALAVATEALSKDGMRVLMAHDTKARISKVLLVCGAPWAQTVTRFIHVEDTEPFVITEEKVKSLIVEAERRDETELKTSDLLKELNVSLVERAVVNTAINGYFVEDPYGKKGTEFSLAHISGLIPEIIVKGIESLEHKASLHVVRKTHTFALVLFCVVRDLYPKITQALIVDISGEATELCIMQEEVLMETCVFPYGTHSFVRDIGALLNNTFPEEVLGHLREYGPESDEKIKKAVTVTQERYLKKLEEALILLEERYTIPRHCIQVTSKNLGAFFDPLIEGFITKYKSKEVRSFISLNKDLLSEKKDAEQNKDVFFVVEARFFHKLHACGEIT
ncbi:hypothetical protein K2X96_00895 [Patescibacteria group bacterium]|nr:hypothetical protein [Patescibacteria group bacterium]